MAITEQELHIIDQKLKNQLSPEEEALFRQKINNPIFQEEYLIAQQSYHAIINYETERLKSRLQDIEQNNNSYTQSRSPVFKYLIIVLIMLGIVLGSYLVYRTHFANQTPQQLYAQYYQPASNDIYPITRSGNQSKIKRGFYAYDTKNYGKTIDLFNSLGKEKEASSIQFFTAQAHMALGEKDKAMNIFHQLADQENDYQPQSLWYLSLLEIRNENTRNAMEHLNKLQGLSTYKKEEVTSLLSSLEGMK